MSPEHLNILIGLMALITLISGSIAVYTSLKIKSSLNEFQVKLVAELDQRYVRAKEYEIQQAGVAKEEIQYRQSRKEKLDDAKLNVDDIKADIVEIRRIADRVEVQLDSLAEWQKRHK